VTDQVSHPAMHLRSSSPTVAVRQQQSSKTADSVMATGSGTVVARCQQRLYLLAVCICSAGCRTGSLKRQQFLI
jgi:hypothetical protein